MEEIFFWVRTMMFPVGLWPLPNKPRHEILKHVICVVYQCIEICHLLEHFYGISTSHTDILIVVEHITFIATMIESIVKGCSFQFQREMMRKMLAIFEDLSENTPIPSNDTKIVESTLKWQKFAHITNKCILLMYITPNIFYNLMPLLTYFHGESGTSLDSSYPFIIAMHVYMAILGSSVVIVFACAENYFLTSIMYICSRIEVLQYSMETAIQESINEKRSTPLFGICVEYHKKILLVTEMLEDFFSFILTVQFISSTVCIGLVLFLAIQGGISFINKLYFGIFFTCMNTQLFIYCYYGQMLTNQFDILSYHGFHSPWYDTPLSFQKDIKFCLARCLKSITLTACKFMPVNLESFFAIAKTSMSYIALLQSMQEEENTD